MELRIEKLCKRYPNGVQALQDVSLHIPLGMFGLLGPNGAGKSTLMRTLATLQEADSGNVSLDGIDVLRQKDEVRRVLGYLPQEFGLYPKVSAQTLLSHFAALKGIANPKERREVVQALLQQTNLFEHRNKPLGSFSGGMKQRFGIAQALLGNPRLIIVDEPTAGLDPGGASAISQPAERHRGKHHRYSFHSHRVGRQRSLRPHGDHSSGPRHAGWRTGRFGSRTRRSRLEENHSAVRAFYLSRALPSDLDAPVRRANIDPRTEQRKTRSWL